MYTLSRQDFESGFLDAVEKRAGLAAPLGLLNTAANIRTLGDMTNAELGLIMDEDLSSGSDVALSGRRAKKSEKPRKLSIVIDDDLVGRLTPEQRKSLFFVVRRIKSGRPRQ